MEHSVVVHIGLRKTGTSALQEILAQEAVSLHDRGIAYPKSLTQFSAHQELAWSLMDPPPSYWAKPISQTEVYAYYEELIEANIRNGATSLLSSEDLSLLYLNFDALYHLKKFFMRYNPLIVYFIRDPISYHISNYKHALISSRERRSFSQYVFDLNRLLYPHYQPFNRILRQVFGDDHIKVLKYDIKKFESEGIYPFFIKNVFGVEVPNEHLGHQSNPGLPNASISFILELNRSNLSDHQLVPIKAMIRKIPQFDKDDAMFLSTHLTDEEITILKQLYSR